MLFSGSLFLAACSLNHVPKHNTEWREQRDWRVFEAEGRIGVQIQERGQTAHFDWIRRNGVETLNVNTPIGTTVGQLCQDAEGVLAVDSGGQVYFAESAETLSRNLLGYALPAQYLLVWANGEWVKGVPYELHQDGSLNQSGWRIGREADERGLARILMLENEQLILRMVFSESRREEGRTDKQERCEARP